MSNWCHNTIRIKGEDLNEIIDLMWGHELGKDEFDFNNVIPYSRNGKGHLDEHDFHCEKWGTKWNAWNVEEDWEEDGNYDLIWNFETAWSPSLPITEKLSLMFPECEFEHEYDEPGMCFAGIDKYYNGKKISYEEYDGDSYIEYCKAKYGEKQ